MVVRLHPLELASILPLDGARLSIFVRYREADDGLLDVADIVLVFETLKVGEDGLPQFIQAYGSQSTVFEHHSLEGARQSLPHDEIP